MKNTWHAIWVALLVAIYFAISNDHIWGELCGRVMKGMGSAPALTEAPTPTGNTALTPGDQQVISMNNFDTSAAKAFKEVTGLYVEPFHEPAQKRFQQEVENAAQSTSEDKSDDAAAATKEEKPVDVSKLSNNELAARNMQKASATDSAQGGAANYLQPGPVVGFGAKVSDPNNQNLAERYVEALRPKLPTGFVAFATKDDSGSDVVAVIKTGDQFEPIKIEGTTGGSILGGTRNNEEIISKLRYWNTKYPLHILSVENDKVVAILDKAPEDPSPLAREVKAFAPGDGGASVDDFASDIRDNKRLFLWWD